MTSSPALNGSLTHEPDRFSGAAWDLLLSGQDVARRWRHEQLDVEHLIQVLFTDPSCRRLVERLPLPIDALLDRLEDVLADQPSGEAQSSSSVMTWNSCSIRLMPSVGVGMVMSSICRKC